MSNRIPLSLSQYKYFLRKVQWNRSKRCQLLNSLQNNTKTRKSPIFSRSVSESEVSQNPTCYFTKNGVLMKTWRPPHVPTEEEWAVQYQMIVPKTYRPDVLSTAGETPLPGHLGVNKTCQRFLDHLYWLSLRKVVTQYCKSFHTC